MKTKNRRRKATLTELAPLIPSDILMKIENPIWNEDGSITAQIDTKYLSDESRERLRKINAFFESNR